MGRNQSRTGPGSVDIEMSPRGEVQPPPLATSHRGSNALHRYWRYDSAIEAARKLSERGGRSPRRGEEQVT